MVVSSKKFRGSPPIEIRTDTREQTVERTDRPKENKGRFSRLDADAPENPYLLVKPCSIEWWQRGNGPSVDLDTSWIRIIIANLDTTKCPRVSDIGVSLT
jgi:hypothetical protein